MISADGRANEGVQILVLRTSFCDMFIGSQASTVSNIVDALKAHAACNIAARGAGGGRSGSRMGLGWGGWMRF